MDNGLDHHQALLTSINRLKDVLSLPVHTPKNPELTNQLNYEMTRNHVQKVLAKAELALSFATTAIEFEELCYAAQEAEAQYKEAYTRYVVIDFEQFNVAVKRVQKSLKEWEERDAGAGDKTADERVRIQQQLNTLLVTKSDLTQQDDIDRATNQLVQMNQLILQQLHRMQMTVEAIKGLVQRAQTRLKEEINPYVRYNSTSLKTYHQFRFQLKQALEKAQFTMEDGLSTTDLVPVKEALEVALTGYEFSKNGLEILEVDSVLQLIEQLETVCNATVDLTDKTYPSAKHYTQSKLAALEVVHQARLVTHQAIEQDEINRVHADVLNALHRVHQAQSDLAVQLDTVQLDRMIYLLRHHVQSNEKQLDGYSSASVMPYRLLLERTKEHCTDCEQALETARSQEAVDALTQQSAELLESLITKQAQLQKLDDRTYRQTLQRVQEALNDPVDVSDKKEDGVAVFEQARIQLLSLEKVAQALVDKMHEQDEIDSIQRQLEESLTALQEARYHLVPKVDRASLMAMVDALEREMAIDEEAYAYDSLGQFKEVSVRLASVIHTAKQVSQTAQTQEEVDVAMQQLAMAKSVVDELKEQMTHLNGNVLEQIVTELKTLIAEADSGVVRMTDSYSEAIAKGKDYLRIAETIQQHSKTQAVIDELVSVVTPIIEHIKLLRPTV